jgi:hypothetical protein
MDEIFVPFAWNCSRHERKQNPMQTNATESSPMLISTTSPFVNMNYNSTKSKNEKDNGGAELKKEDISHHDGDGPIMVNNVLST